jgi:hypothetical protein
MHLRATLPDAHAPSRTHEGRRSGSASGGSARRYGTTRAYVQSRGSIFALRVRRVRSLGYRAHLAVALGRSRANFGRVELRAADNGWQSSCCFWLYSAQMGSIRPVLSRIPARLDAGPGGSATSVYPGCHG